MELEVVDVEGLGWNRGKSARFWCLQPNTQLTATPPIAPNRNGKTPALRLLEATLQAEGAFPDPEQAPAFILLPEFAVHPEEVGAAIELAKGARPNTVVVFGLGQLAEGQARALEPEVELWHGPSEGRFTNSAVIVFGRSARVFLQPKIVRSRWEQDSHWLGRTVRYFAGKHVQFIVLICSELLNRPDGETTAKAIVDKINEVGRQLNLVIWIQHNPKPRSPEFVSSVEEFLRLRSTIFVVGSRAERSPNRVNNYAVSGAIIPHEALATHFDLLTKRFHYVEPIPTESPLARVVLLRYDADAYRIGTVLAQWIDANDKTAKAALFEESQPYVLRGTTLAASTEHFHITDICVRPTRLARMLVPALADQVGRASTALEALSTGEFLAVLDVGILPRPVVEEERHVAGAWHPDGDYRCRCWRHRECVDRIADEDESAEPVAHLLTAMAALDACEVPVRPAYNRVRRTNFVADLEDTEVPLGIVYPFNFDAEGTERGLWGKNRVALVDSAYVILGVGERAVRPKVETVDSALARPVGAIRAGAAVISVLRAIYSAEFWDAFGEARLKTVVRERFI